MGSNAERRRPRSRAALVLVMLVALAVAVGGALAGSAPAAATSDRTSAGHGFKLGFAYGLENTPIYQNVLRPARYYAKGLKVTLQLGNADSKCDKQLDDMQNMIQAGVKAITFLGLCGKGDAYDKVIAEAQAKHVVTVSYSFAHPDADGSILFNDAAGAKAFGANAVAWIKKHFKAPYSDFSYATLPCSFAPPSIQSRTKIVAAAIEKLTHKKPYASVDCALSPALGKKAVDTYLQKDPGLDMVIGVVDAGAYGAYLSFKQAGKAGKVYVGGMDGTREAIQLLARGGDGIYQYSGALSLQAVGHAVVQLPYNVINDQGSANVLLNYTGITASRPAQAKKWLQDNFLKFQKTQ